MASSKLIPIEWRLIYSIVETVYSTCVSVSSLGNESLQLTTHVLSQDLIPFNFWLKRLLKILDRIKSCSRGKLCNSINSLINSWVVPKTRAAAAWQKPFQLDCAAWHVGIAVRHTTSSARRSFLEDSTCRGICGILLQRVSVYNKIGQFGRPHCMRWCTDVSWVVKITFVYLTCRYVFYILDVE